MQHLNLEAFRATAFWWHPRNPVLRAVGERVAGNTEAAGSGIEQQAPMICKKLCQFYVFADLLFVSFWINFMLS